MPATANSAPRPFRVLVLCLATLALVGCQPQPRQQSSFPADRPSSPRPEPRPDRQTNSQDARQYPQRQRSRQASRNSRTHTDGDPHFDFYLLNLSWSPEFCFKRPDAPECAQHRAFTLHGLWPQRFDGTYPEHCSDTPGPRDPAQFHDLYPDAGLLEHEWQTHGTCSGLDPDAFFNQARQAVNHVRIPAQLTSLDHQTALPPEAILTLFTQTNPDLPRSSLALSCGSNFLTAVELCLDKQLHPIACSAVRSCRANSVRIPPVRP